jgi:hypothetical protein
MRNLRLLALFILATLPLHADSVRFARVNGGPPLPGVSDAKTDLGTIRGDEFKKVKGQVQKVVAALVKHERWMPKEAAWWDVGPDAGYVSAIIELEGKTYTINSWFPLQRRSLTVAVSEKQGLVAVKSKKGKAEVESRNSAAYKQIVAIFDLMPQPKRGKSA